MARRIPVNLEKEHEQIMIRKALFALALLGLSQHGYSLSFSDVLKETVRQVADQKAATPQDGSKAEGGSGQTAAKSKSTGTVLNATDFRANPNDELMKQGMWSDPKTGLIWFRCNVGQTWSGTACEGGSNFSTVDEAMLGASQMRLGGHGDWRLPTIDEIETIKNCAGKGGFIEDYAYQDYQAQDGSTKRSYGRCNEGEPVLGTAAIFPAVNPWYWLLGPKPGEGAVMQGNAISYIGSTTMNAMAMAVRGGQPSASYAQRLAQVQARHGQQVAAEKAADQANQQKAAEFERQTKELRKRVKPGDRTAQGLVLAVNGDLVKVQTYARECASFKTVRNPVSGQFDCWRYETVVAGEQWIRRDEIRPVYKINQN
jgi:hypothetical protein